MAGFHQFAGSPLRRVPSLAANWLVGLRCAGPQGVGAVRADPGHYANLVGMEVTFTHRPDGGVDARVVGGVSLFDEVFADCINATAPSGAPMPHLPSTYWIDRARARTLAAIENPSVTPIAHGNATIVTIDNGHVVARFDFDPEPDTAGEAIPVDQFIEILDRWRDHVLARSPEAAANFSTA